VTITPEQQAEQPALRCATCGAAGEFGYRDVDGTILWFCARHRLAYYTRSNSEICLLAIKGSPMRLATDVHEIVIAPRISNCTRASRCPAGRCGVTRFHARAIYWTPAEVRQTKERKRP
jgi:hypothetical protein